MAYSSVSITGYNASPPPDDGSQTEANKVCWSKIKTKLTDPLKTGLESINSQLVSELASLNSIIVTADDMVRFHAYQAASQNNLTSGSYTQLTVSSEYVDSDNTYASNTWTPGVARPVLLHAYAGVDPDSTGVGSGYLAIYKNGSAWRYGGKFYLDGIPVTLSITTVDTATTATDTYELYLYHENGVTEQTSRTNDNNCVEFWGTTIL